MSIADAETLASIRARAHKIIRELDPKSCGSVKEDLPSWVRGGNKDTITSGPDERSSRCRYFDNHGFVHVPGFANVDTEVSAMKKQMQDLASGWDPTSKISVFRTDEGQTDAQGSDHYFLTSASKVHFFTEKDATDKDGELKREFVDNKVICIRVEISSSSSRLPIHLFFESTCVLNNVLHIPSIHCRWRPSTKPVTVCT